MDIVLSALINYSVLVITQFILGKKGAFLYALLFEMNLYVVSLVIIGCDILLIFLVASLFRVSAQHIFPFTWLQRKAESKEYRLKHSTFAQNLVKIGKVGTLIITAIPFSGGVWSGMLLARILQLKKDETYWLVGVGSVFGCLIFLLAALGMVQLI